MASEKQPDLQDIEAVERYSAFTTAEKWCIVAMVSYAAWFSTLSSFIYYPALHSISRALDVSIDKINLTVTSYLAVATIAPTLVGDTADVLGRRPVYLIALSLYLAADIAIALSRDYSALLGLRVLQATAISGMGRPFECRVFLADVLRDVLDRLRGAH
jgi:MFS family permease